MTPGPLGSPLTAVARSPRTPVTVLSDEPTGNHWFSATIALSSGASTTCSPCTENGSYEPPLTWKRTSWKPVFNALRTKRTAQTADAGLFETPAMPPQEMEFASEMIAGTPAAVASATTHARLRGLIGGARRE